SAPARSGAASTVVIDWGLLSAVVLRYQRASRTGPQQHGKSLVAGGQFAAIAVVPREQWVVGGVVVGPEPSARIPTRSCGEPRSHVLSAAWREVFSVPKTCSSTALESHG